MTDVAHIFMMVAVPGLPFLLAIPALRGFLPRATPLALLPAVVLLFIPGSVSVELPWLLLGDSGFTTDGLSRWWLAVSVLVWGGATAMLYARGRNEPDRANQMTWFLLTQTGQLGAVLAADLISFFAFSSLMGYAFFGFLMIEKNMISRRGGSIYLVLLILADIALFEALLVIAGDAADLRFANLAAEIARSPDAGFSVWLALIAFAFKAGIWPLQFWLPAACGSARATVPLVLWIAPVTTGLLGMIRWLPLGEATATLPGTLLQGAGIATILYAASAFLWQSRRGHGIAYFIIATTGVVVLVLGSGLAEPLIWSGYGNLVPIIIAGIGLGLVLTISIDVWYRRGQMHSRGAKKSISLTPTWYERWTQTLLHRLSRLGLVTLPTLRFAIHNSWRSRWHKHTWQGRLDSGEGYFRWWTFAILLVLLLSILITLAGIIFGNG